MGWVLTSSIAAGALAFGAFCGWRGARPPDFTKGPRLIPWRGLMLLSAVVVLAMLVHLANLAGVKTGR